MKTKLTLLAAVILAGVGTSIALDTATVEKPSAMSCCAKMPKAPVPTADKDAPATTSMSCHTDTAVAKDATPVKAKGCCK